jgi:lauroyl/myristoyl acyltransferase
MKLRWWNWMRRMTLLLCGLILRSARLVAFNFFALGSALLILLALLRLTQTSMSLLSLLAVPLLIGLVVDYSLHLLLVLENHGGDLRITYRHLAVPVCLTGLTSMIGFGSPMITRQPALQNFGFVMDLGVFSAVVAGLVILPAFYFRRSQRLAYSRVLYRAFLLEAAACLCGWIGLSAARRLGRFSGALYGWTHPRKTAIVGKNLSLLSRDPIPNSSARRVFSNYGMTFADYLTLRSYSKEQAMKLIVETEGLEHLHKAREEGNGCLIVTAHLGLFEFGGLLLSDFGFPTTVLTLPEPSPELTEWRARYRKRWDIETLEVGEEDFSFLKIVRELRHGKFVAALADRPYQRNYVPVDFPNGKVPFSSGPVLISLLARCPIIPGAIVVLPSGGYRMQAYPPLYPHRHDGDRDQVIRLFTGEIARALLPALCHYPGQWYQFGPVSC